MNVPQLNQDPSQYDSLGYCVFRGVLDADAIASVQQDLEKVLEAIPAKMMVYKDGQQVEADGRPELVGRSFTLTNSSKVNPILIQTLHSRTP